MMNKLRSLSIAMRVLVSASAGTILPGFLVVPIIGAISWPRDPDADVLYEDCIAIYGIDCWLHDFPIDVMLNFFASLVFMVPLIVVALPVALVFRKSIERHPATWCFTAPLLIWLCICVFIALACDSSYCQSHTFFDNFAKLAVESVGPLIFWGPMPTAVIFYLLTRNANVRRPQPR